MLPPASSSIPSAGLNFSRTPSLFHITQLRHAESSFSVKYKWPDEPCALKLLISPCTSTRPGIPLLSVRSILPVSSDTVIGDAGTTAACGLAILAAAIFSRNSKNPPPVLISLLYLQLQILLQRPLNLPKPPIQPLLRQQLLWRPMLRDPSVLQHHHLIRQRQSRDPMGDDD